MLARYNLSDAKGAVDLSCGGVLGAIAEAADGKYGQTREGAVDLRK